MKRFLLIVILLYKPMVSYGQAPSNEMNINQDQTQSQTQITYSQSSSDVSINTTHITQRPFPAGVQPQIPQFSPVYGGPWKEGWNIINTDIYKLFETYWPVREAKRELKEDGGRIKSISWDKPYFGSVLPKSMGVNVVFQLNKESSIPDSAIPLGIIIVKGTDKATLWHLVAAAVIEASKKGASWLDIYMYNYIPCVKSSAFGLGLASTAAAINPAGDLSGVSGGGTGWATAKANPATEPFIHAVAYALPHELKSAIEVEKIKKEISYKSAFVKKETVGPAPIKTEPRIPERPESLKMIVKNYPDKEKVIVFVRVKNVTREKIYVSPIYFRLETKDGKLHPYSLDTYTIQSRFMARRLEPNEETEGYLVFKIDDLPKRLIYDDQSQRVSVFSNL